jgi:type IV pilus assembly protein PilC
MRYVYKAVTTDGRTRRGVIEAPSPRDALLTLREQGIFVTSLNEAQRWRRLLEPREGSLLARQVFIGRPVKPRDFAVMVRQLATLLRAGVVITDALSVLAQQTENKVLGRTLRDMVAKLQAGVQFSQAAAEHSRIFPPVFVNMLRAGETSGDLELVLDRLATFHEREHYTRQKVKSALTYPVVVAILAVCVTAFLLIKVIPTFVSLFAGYNLQLPLPTRIVIAVSNALLHGWYFWLSFLVVATLGYQVVVRRPRGRYWRDRLWLKVPVFGELTRKAVIARMSRTLGTLFASGVPILQALQLTSDVVDNAVIADVLRRSAESLKEGQTLSEPISRSGVFPPLVGHMFHIGEETGQLDAMLAKLADFYEAETEAMADQLRALLEPLMVLILAGVVGVIVTSVILPMFSLYQAMGNMG